MTSTFTAGEHKLSSRLNRKEKRSRVVSPEDIQRDNINRKNIGDIAEQKVFEYVKKKVYEVFGDEFAAKVKHVAKTKDGLGYDIEAFDYRNPTFPPKPVKIEVKGTTSIDRNSTYFISYPELEKFILHKDELWVVRVFGVTRQSNLVMEIDDEFSQYNSAAELLLNKYNYLPQIIEVFGTKTDYEGE